MPPDWRAPPIKATQAIGNDWVARGASLLLRVPSVVVPAKHNHLLNPAHPSFDDVILTPPEKFRFDERLAGLVEAQSQTLSEDVEHEARGVKALDVSTRLARPPVVASPGPLDQ